MKTTDPSEAGARSEASRRAVGQPIDIAVVGIGKIARDQHLPAIAASERFRLVAAASRNAQVDGVANFPDLDALLDAVPGCAVSLCAPPAVRTAMALQAIGAGRDVMIEKPPAASLGEIVLMRDAARAAGVTLFATWHSREAPGVEPAREWLASRRIERVEVSWKEDVRRWHPGQDWVFEPGGFGVLDPGINALSILTRILPAPLVVEDAVLRMPENRDQPIAGTIDMRGGTAPVRMELDWLQEGEQSWDIQVETDGGRLALTGGGAHLAIGGEARDCGPEREYPALYDRFADLVAARTSDVDAEPLRLVADAYLRARFERVAPFAF